MGCVSSTLLNQDEDFPTGVLSHHIVSLTSTTYGLLNLDPPTTPPLPFTIPSDPPTPTPPPPPPEVINSWELMAGLLDPSSITNATSSSSPFSPLPPPQPSKRFPIRDITNIPIIENRVHPNLRKSNPLDAFEILCPPNGENRVVIYTTTLRGIRKTFEACNAVRTAFEGFGVVFCERDISMDRGFKEELRLLLKGKQDSLPPRVFVKGRYVGGAEQVMRFVEEGSFGELVRGLPTFNFFKASAAATGGSRYACETCGGVRFLPCFRCNGSCKIVREAEDIQILCQKKRPNNVIVARCSDCNENGLVLCPVCS